MIGAPPPADAAGPFQNKFVKALTGLLATNAWQARVRGSQRGIAPLLARSGSRSTSMTSNVLDL